TTTGLSKKSEIPLGNPARVFARNCERRTPRRKMRKSSFVRGRHLDSSQIGLRPGCRKKVKFRWGTQLAFSHVTASGEHREEKCESRRSFAVAILIALRSDYDRAVEKK